MIRYLRKKHGYSQDELARMTGYSDRSSIAKIEAGKVDLSQSKIALFAKIFNITPGELMGWEEAKDNLSRAGFTLEDVAEEMNLPLGLIEQVVNGEAPASAAETVVEVANLLAAQKGTINVEIAAREYSLLIRYRSADDKSRTVVDTVLDL